MNHNLYTLFNDLLNVKYMHLGEQDASYYHRREDDHLIIYFEWSNGKVDWKNNLDFPAKPYRDMHDRWFAHRGFLRVWKVIEPHLKALILDPTIHSITIAGFSHGAAIALLCHEYCMYNRPDIREDIVGYGFGCPRVVWGRPNRTVKRRFEGFTVIRNCRDIVTHVPPALFGYRHVGCVLKIGLDAGLNGIDSHRPENIARELRRL